MVSPSAFDREFEQLRRWLHAEGGGFSRNEAAERLDVSIIRIAQLTAGNELEFMKFQSIVIISRRSLENFERRREGFPQRNYLKTTGRPPGEIDILGRRLSFGIVDHWFNNGRSSGSGDFAPDRLHASQEKFGIRERVGRGASFSVMRILRPTVFREIFHGRFLRSP